MAELGKERGREKGRKRGEEGNIDVQGEKVPKEIEKENRYFLFISGFLVFRSPFIQNRPIDELAAAWRMVGSVSQEWGARRPRSEPILKWSGACRTKEAPKVLGCLDGFSGYSRHWIVSPLFSPCRSLGWNGILNFFFKGSGKVNKQPCKDNQVAQC